MLIFVRRKGRHNDTMEQANGKPGRHFTPQQKYDILKDIERCATIQAGLDKHGIASSVYYKWKRQLSVGINASLRNTKPELLSIVGDGIFSQRILSSIIFMPPALPGPSAHHQQRLSLQGPWG